MKEICVSCKEAMKKAEVPYKGLKLEALQCPKCRRKIFTEELAMKAVSELEANRLKDSYSKRPIRIGHSFGITFPKDVVEVFQLDSKIGIKIIPNVEKDIIELRMIRKN